MSDNARIFNLFVLLVMSAIAMRVICGPWPAAQPSVSSYAAAKLGVDHGEVWGVAPTELAASDLAAAN